jgi:hypothetical protein
VIKQTVRYTDFNDQVCVEDAWFHASQAELATIVDLQPRIVAWQTKVENGGVSRNLTVSEIKELLDLTKIMVKLSYGKRSDDGKYFRKSDEIWNDFKDSGAHDAFLLELFQDPTKNQQFFEGIVSKEVLAQARREEALKTQASVDPNAPAANISTLKDNQPPFDPSKNFTPAELRELTPDQLAQAWEYKSTHRE